MSENIYKPYHLHKNHTNIYEFASFMFKPQNVVIQEDTSLPILLTNDRPEGWRYLRDYEKQDWIKYNQSLKQKPSSNKKEDANQKIRKGKSFKFQWQSDKQKHIPNKPNKSFQQIEKEKRILEENEEREKHTFINKRIQNQERYQQKIDEIKHDIFRKRPQEQQSQELRNISQQIEFIKSLLLKKDHLKKEVCQECASRRDKKQDLLNKLQQQQQKSMKFFEENIFLKETIKQLISNKDYLQLYLKQLNQNSSSKYFTIIMKELKDLKKNRQQKNNESLIFSGQESFRQERQDSNIKNQLLIKKVDELEDKNLSLESQIKQLTAQLRNKEKINLKQQQQINTLKYSKRNIQLQRQEPIFYSRMTVNKNISAFITKNINTFTKQRISKAILLYQKDEFNTNIFNYFDRSPFPVLILFQTMNNVIFGAFAEGTQTYLTNRRNLEESKPVRFRVFLFNASQQIIFNEDEKNEKSIGLSFTQNYLRFGNNQVFLKNNSLDKITVQGNSIFGQKYFKMFNRKSLTGEAGDIVEIKGIQIHQLLFQQE